MAYQGVTLKGTIPGNDLTFVLNADITAQDVGKAVTQDTSAANTVKLAGAGDPIFGRLETFEDRVVEGVKVGAVKIIAGMELPTASGYTAQIGDKVIGAAGGMVTKIGQGESSDLSVWEVKTGSVIVVKTH
jgi:hypothetical protein